MGNSDGIWQWCRDGKKTILRKSKTRSMVDEHSSLAKDGSTPNIIPKGKQCVDYSPISKSSTTHEGDALKSRTYWTNSSISVIQNQVSLSETNSDAMTDNTHYISGPNGWLPSTLGFRGESSVEDTDFYHRKQPSKSRIHRMVQQAAFKQNRLLSDQGIDSSCQTRYAARQKETSANASSSCSISKVVVEDLDLQSLTVNKQMSVVDGYEASSHYNNCPCHPPACNKHMRDHGLVSEDQITKSEILFPELHILADTAIRSESLQNDESHFHENITQKEGSRREILQKKGIKKASSKHRQPDGPQMLHDLQKDLSAANSKALLTVDDICKLGNQACIKESEKQVVHNGVDEDPMAIRQLRRSKRCRHQGLPSKYDDFVLQPCKKTTRR